MWLALLSTPTRYRGPSLYGGPSPWRTWTV